MDPKMASQSHSFEVLYEREKIELDACLQNIGLFSKYIRDYESLLHRLTTLSDKTTHDIMVPIAGSKLAFMPGYIHHTNEVLVLIGDNYFVEKSTKEAMEFVNRRIAFCHKKIEELQSQQRMLQNWLGATADMKAENELVDIIETWSEEDLQKWKVKHQTSVQQHRKQLMCQNVDTDLNAILDKYEKEELGEIVDEENKEPPKAHSSTHVTEQLINLSLTERSEPPPSSTAKLDQKGDSQERPISKFKASRMQR